MNNLKVISEKTKLKILKYAVVIINEHGSIAGDRCCQDWSIDKEVIESPETGFTKQEQEDISFNHEQWNSNGEDYDPDFTGFGDEMSVSFMLSRALDIMVKELDLINNGDSNNE